MMQSNSELRGDSHNPYHFSVGAVIRKDDTFAIIHKQGIYYTLLRETAHVDESISECLNRGSQEELGVTVQIERFLGGLITHFTREESDMDIEKTTIYFEAHVVNETGEKKQEEDEVNDTIHWVSFDEACSLLEGDNNPEFEILKRTKME